LQCGVEGLRDWEGVENAIGIFVEETVKPLEDLRKWLGGVLSNWK